MNNVAYRPDMPNYGAYENAAGFKDFRELISPFLREKLAIAQHEGDETVLRVLGRQYLRAATEEAIRPEETLKHYEAGETVVWEGERLYGVERLYRRVILFEPLYQCIAHCRFCLRRNYDKFYQTPETIQHIARYIGGNPGHEDLREVLVTGGDPFLAPDKIRVFLETLSESAPQIETVRVATRVPIHQPDRVNARVLEVLGFKWPFRIEVATHINHAAELFPEVEDAYRRILDTVRVVYNQSVLLSGVNDTLDELVELCDLMRALGIENHYLFQCVPIGGMNTLRTTLAESIELARQLAACGRISGRAKPQFALMTPVGKITLYEGAVLAREGHRYLLNSGYSYDERRAWNPHWQLPPQVEVGDDGIMRVWYEDKV